MNGGSSHHLLGASSRSVNTVSGQSKQSTSRSKLFGDITLEAIDEFLNPLSRKNQQNTIKYLPTSDTFGMGLIGNDTDEEDDSDDNSSISNNRPGKEHLNDYKYVEQLKEEYEEELRQHFHRQNNFNDTSTVINESLYTAMDEVSSVVGSQMSQIESVSSMHMPTAKKNELMRKVKYMTHLSIQEEEDGLSMANSDFNNNNAKILANIVDEEKKLFEKPDEQIKEENFHDFCNDYQIRNNYDPKLPITKMRHLIVNKINTYQFVVIQGGTGTGKTTQVPQYILDHHVQEKKYCNIIVTQPRRIAAVSIAARVCFERGWDLGMQCGYQIGLDKKVEEKLTRITYCTTGVLLQKLVGECEDRNFNQHYTHIILDEVHERDLDTDFVLLLIKLKSYQKFGAKIILMSATMNTDMFLEYYKTLSRDVADKFNSPCLINIESQTYNVTEEYWEDLLDKPMDQFRIEPTKMFREKYLRASQTNNNGQGSSYFSINNNHVNSKNNSRFSNNSSMIVAGSTTSTSSKSFLFESEYQLVSDLKSRIIRKKFDYENPEMSEEQVIMAINLIRHFDTLDNQDLTRKYVEYLNQQQNDNKTVTQQDRDKPGPERLSGFRIINQLSETRGSVLIFVPGMHQIQHLQEAISHEFSDRYQLIIYPLHSDIVPEQQNKVFEKMNPFYRKIIISTGISESSITVPDIKYVIDFCLAKELYCDPSTNYSHLRLEWASKSSLKQRRGRAGRVMDGKCYRLIKREFYKELLPQTDPAILREPLTSVILNLKRLTHQIGEPKKILSLAIQPPKLSDIERNVLLLKEVGGLTLKCHNSRTLNNNSANTYNSNNYAHDGDLTYAGRIMAHLPIDVKLSKLILLGHAFGKLKESIIIAAGLSKKTFFTCYYKSYMESFNAKWIYSQGWMCDCLCILNAYLLYEAEKPKFDRTKNNKAEREWCRNRNIEYGRIKEVYVLVNELTKRLQNLGIYTNHDQKLNYDYLNGANQSEYNIDDYDDTESRNLILKMIIAGAFYPNYFKSDPLDVSEAVKIAGGYSLVDTVQIKNLPMNEGILYTEKLREMFAPCSKTINIHFEGTKAYIEFKSKHDDVATNVNIGVYRAILMRFLRLPMTLKRYNVKETSKRLQDELNRSMSSLKINVSLDAEKFGQIKFTNQASSRDNHEANISHNTTLIEDEEDHFLSSDDEFLNPKPRNLANEKKGPREFFSAWSLNNSSKINPDSTIVSTTSTISLKNSVSASLSTNKVTACNNDLLPYLSNPKFILPPKVGQGESIKVAITEVVACGHFYVQISDEKHEQVLAQIDDFLNDPNTFTKKTIKNEMDLIPDQLCIAYYSDAEYDPALYRARILQYDPSKQIAQIQYVDYGNVSKVKSDQLYEYPSELNKFPFQAIECKIINIRPNVTRNPNGIWTSKLSKRFREKVMDKEHSNEIIVRKIESNVAYVNLVTISLKNKFKINFDEYLVKEGYAEFITTGAYRNESMSNLSMHSSHETLYIPVRQANVDTKMPQYLRNNQNYSTLHINKNNSVNINRSFLNDSELDISYDTDVNLSNSRVSEFENEDESLFSGEIDIRGPISPLEVNFYAMVNVGSTKKVRPDRDSINFSSIDDVPDSECGRLMIASDLALSANTESILLRKTTLMPKLPGIASLCCLMFSPSIELRLNEARTMYTGALCGLGYDKNAGAIHPDNDVEVAFDVDIDVQDLAMINGVRLAINLVIGNDENVKIWTNSKRNLRKLQQQACLKMLKVIKRNREIVEPIYFRRPHKWNQIKKERFMPPFKNHNSDEFSSSTNLNGEEQLYFSYHNALAIGSDIDSS